MPTANCQPSSHLMDYSQNSKKLSLVSSSVGWQRHVVDIHRLRQFARLLVLANTLSCLQWLVSNSKYIMYVFAIS